MFVTMMIPHHEQAVEMSDIVLAKDGLDPRVAGDGGGRRIEDSLHFRGGFYWSKGCIACSFAPGPYSARAVEGGVEFTGVLESPERGVFSYAGLVTETGLVAEIGWRRERWYWTLERGFRFEGVSARLPEADLDAAFERAGAPRDPACTI